MMTPTQETMIVEALTAAVNRLPVGDRKFRSLAVSLPPPPSRAALEELAKDFRMKRAKELTALESLGYQTIFLIAGDHVARLWPARPAGSAG